MFKIGLVIINVSISICLRSHYNQPLSAQSWQPGPTAFQKGMFEGHFTLPHSWQFESCYNSAKEHRGFPSQVPSWFWLLFISSPCLNSRSKIEEVLLLHRGQLVMNHGFNCMNSCFFYKQGGFTYSSGQHRNNLKNKDASIHFFIFLCFWNILTFEWL